MSKLSDVLLTKDVHILQRARVGKFLSKILQKPTVHVQYDCDYCVQYIDINIFQCIELCSQYIEHPHLHGPYIARIS